MSNQKSKNKAQVKKKKSNSLWLWVGVAFILVLVVGAVLFLRNGTDNASSSLPAEIDVAQAAEMRDAGAYILDVREPSEWQEYHIPGATLIPLGELASRVSEVPQDQEIVVVCRSGNRSQQGRDILLKHVPA